MKISEFRDLLANDGFAATFQTMGQYRTELLRALDGLRAQDDAAPVAWMNPNKPLHMPITDGMKKHWDKHWPDQAEDFTVPLFLHPSLPAAQGLSDEQIFDLWCSIPTQGGIDDDIVPFARALLARAATVAEPSEKLDAPAQVGNTVFRTGVERRLVVEAAQRNYQRIHNPTEEDKLIAAAAERLADLVERRISHGVDRARTALAAQSGQWAGVAEGVIEAAAKKLAEQFDYPWEHMPAQGKDDFRVKVRDIAAILSAPTQQQERSE